VQPGLSISLRRADVFGARRRRRSNRAARMGTAPRTQPNVAATRKSATYRCSWPFSNRNARQARWSKRDRRDRVVEAVHHGVIPARFRTTQRRRAGTEAFDPHGRAVFRTCAPRLASTGTRRSRSDGPAFAGRWRSKRGLSASSDGEEMTSPRCRPIRACAAQVPSATAVAAAGAFGDP
jgi:hypothetical protein